MKQILLSFLLLAIGVSAMAGIKNKKQAIKSKHLRTAKVSNVIGHDQATQAAKTETLPVYKAKKLKAPVGEVVGITTYDLQTNSGVCRRVANNPPGTFTYVGWTMGMDFTSGAPNRGTGFNFYNRNTGQWGPIPTRRIEPSTRVGWPSIGFSQGRQFSITHTGSQGMMFCYRTGNQSDWTEVIVGEIVNDTGGVWARAAAEAPNIYAVIGRPFDSEPFNGINGGLNVIRSTDNGNNWESLGGLEENYGGSYALNMTADTYQIDAANGVVSVVFGTAMTPVVLYKSTDMAETWSKTIVQPMSGNELVQDLNNDAGNPNFGVDPYYASDGGNSVIIDSEGKSHVIFSSRIIFNPSDNDFVGSGGSYFLLRETSALFYWNEDMDTPEMLGKSILNDANDDGMLGSVFNTLISVGMLPFYSNMIAHPQLAVDGDDNLYLSYSALVDGAYVPPVVEFESSTDEGETTGVEMMEFEEESTLFSDVFMLKSTDKGATWQGPLNVTNAPGSEEGYPSIARFIKDTIFLAYQHDALPGTLLQDPQTLATINEIAVVKILPEDINDEAAAKDSEPYLSILFDSFILPQNCSLDKDMSLLANSWGLDYPDGEINEIQLEGMADYSTIGEYTEAIYVEDSAGNRSDTVHVTVQIVADEHAPVIEIDGACTEFAVLAGSDWENPSVKITDMAEFDGEVTDSGCDVSENLQVEDNVNTGEVGSYTVVYTVSDFAGNEGSLTLNVEVIAEDTDGPEIIVNNLPELVGLFDPFNPADVEITAKDNVDCENVTIDVEGLDEINTEELGDYDITITATDQSGNMTVEERTITVGDNTAPTIQLDGPYTIVVMEVGQCGSDGVFDANDDPGVYASDDTDGDLTSMVEAVYNDGNPIDCNCGEGGDEFYIITYTVTDATGNVGMAERSVRIEMCGVGIEDNPIYEFVDIFPNPTKGQLNIETANLKVSEISVYNLIGKNIVTLNEDQVKALTQLDLSDQAEGIYMVNIVTDKGTITRKVNVVRN